MGLERKQRTREDRFAFNRRKKCLIIKAKQNQNGLRVHWGTAGILGRQSGKVRVQLKARLSITWDAGLDEP